MVINMEIYKNYCLVYGKGKDTCKIGSFDSALIDAGVGNYNLVKISSILPPQCQHIDNIVATPGSILHTAYIAKTTKKSERIAVAIAVAIPKDRKNCGVIIKHSLKGTQTEAEEIAVLLAKSAMGKRGVSVSHVEVIGSEVQGDDTCYSTAFAGLALSD